MNRPIIWMAMCGLALSLACGREEAKDMAGDAAVSAKQMAGEATASAEKMAKEAAQTTRDAAKSSAAAVSGAAKSMADKAGGMAGAPAADAVSTCRSLAERGAWSTALEACKKAHEMLPNDMAIEHAYQQAKAAAG